MQALGLIETKGLIAAVESADAMLKAAQVTLIEKTYVGGGLVLIAVTGGVAAVKAAVEAGAAAVKIIDSTLLVSWHVIPRPHEELNHLIKFPNNESAGIKAEQKEGASDAAAKDTTAEDIATEDTTAEDMAAEDTTTEDTTAEDMATEDTTTEDTTVKGTTTEDTTAEDTSAGDSASEDKATINSAIADLPEVKENFLPDKGPDEANKEMIDKLVVEYDFEKALEVLSGLKVVKLRNLAREYTDLGISGRTISKADKKMLLSKLKDYYRKNS